MYCIPTPLGNHIQCVITRDIPRGIMYRPTPKIMQTKWRQTTQSERYRNYAYSFSMHRPRARVKTSCHPPSVAKTASDSPRQKRVCLRNTLHAARNLPHCMLYGTLALICLDLRRLISGAIFLRAICQSIFGVRAYRCRSKRLESTDSFTTLRLANQ